MHLSQDFLVMLRDGMAIFFPLCFSWQQQHFPFEPAAMVQMFKAFFQPWLAVETLSFVKCIHVGYVVAQHAAGISF